MWRRRPGLMLLGMVPALIVFLLLLAAFLVLLWKVDDLVDWATPFADDWSHDAADGAADRADAGGAGRPRCSCPR